MGAVTLPAGWAEIPLGEAAQWLNGRAFKKSEWESEGRPIIRIQNLNDPDAEFNRTKREFEDRYRVEEGDLLFAWAASLGAYEWRGESGWLNQHIFKVIPAAGVDKKFLFHFLKRVISDIYARTQGTGMVHITKSQFSSIPLLLPPEGEQRRIVAKIEELFSELDESVANLQTARARLQTYRQSLLKHAFEGGLTDQWRRDHADELESSDQLVERIREERQARYQEQLDDWKAAMDRWEVDQGSRRTPPKPASPGDSDTADSGLGVANSLPYGWFFLRMGNLCNVVRGGSPRPAGSPKYYGGSIPFLKVADVTQGNGVYLKTFEHTITQEGLSKTRFVPSGELIISNSGATLGVPRICQFSTTCNDGVAVFMGLPERCKSYFYFYWLYQKEKLRAINQGAAQPNLNTTMLSQWQVPVCSLHEMQVIAWILESNLEQIESLETEIDTRVRQQESLKQSILKFAFDGRLVSRDLNEESGSHLLTRIRSERMEPAEGYDGVGTNV